MSLNGWRKQSERRKGDALNGGGAPRNPYKGPVTG